MFEYQLNEIVVIIQSFFCFYMQRRSVPESYDLLYLLHLSKTVSVRFNNLNRLKIYSNTIPLMNRRTTSCTN